MVQIDRRRFLAQRACCCDFPGGTVDLRYWFRPDGDRIARLDIAP